MIGRILLIALSPLCLAVSFLAEDPLLKSAGWITGSVALYTALYVREYFLLHLLGYIAGIVGIALFVQGKSWIWIFAGWELVSVVAWILIVYPRGGTLRGLEIGVLTFLVNRIGDLFWLAAAFSEARFSIGFLIAGWIKAGLFPFTFWLIQAMYAPAPISALFHSALLVSLGVYGFLRYPTWLSGLDRSLIELLAEGSGVFAAIGALSSRHPKVLLAWTTASHLSGAMAIVASPAPALNLLLHHAYLKAALFLLLGLFYKQRSPSLLLRSVSFLFTTLLIASKRESHILAHIRETLMAVALGRMWRLLGSRNHDESANWQKEVPFLLPILLLVIRGEVAFGLTWSLESLIPILGLVGGAYWRTPISYRLDLIFIRVTQRLLHLWEEVGKKMTRVENFLKVNLENLSKHVVSLSNWIAKGETWSAHIGWKTIASRTRQALALLGVQGQKASYKEALQWGVLITLMGAFTWRLLR
ncbi:MAG: proton-conducting transporter membrane subunit [Bacteroidia bacterium]|nr:hypothetical protein [Bacteroidia bacterium]MDW8133800.1 proton-conducting transporter membrane subunit [Bacteroidia bacterium]